MLCFIRCCPLHVNVPKTFLLAYIYMNAKFMLQNLAIYEADEQYQSCM